MVVVSVSFPWNRLLEALCLLFADNECALDATGYLSLYEEVLIDIFGDSFIMVVDNILLLLALFRETGSFGVVVVEFAFSNGLHFSRTSVEVYVGVAARLPIYKSLPKEECSARP